MITMKTASQYRRFITQANVFAASLSVALAVVAGCGVLNPTDAASARDDSATTQSENNANMIKVHIFNNEGELIGPVDSEKIIKSDEEWKELLSPEQYRILRNDGTERAFCGTLLDNKTEGVYTCAACGLPLFSSVSKFKSGTGWPSFFQPIDKTNISEVVDSSLGMTRTEINCARCDGHLGHVFADGPQPTGLRYCLNSESLAFTSSEDVASLAENPAAPTERATAVFAGGCFWCVEAVLEELDGVEEVISGYAGGIKETADYKTVCTGTTGHAEAVRVVYDPAKISFTDLLRVHFAMHDPTQLNRQGNDYGQQYRSAIFYRNEKEKALAEAFLEDLRDSGLYKGKIVTTLEPLKEDAFYKAESYHQNFVCNNPMQGYVRAIALPKVEKVRKQFKDKLKEKSPLDR